MGKCRQKRLMLAIADLAGGEWADQARQAATPLYDPVISRDDIRLLVRLDLIAFCP